MANFQPLDIQQHKQLKIKADPQFLHAKKSHIVPLSVFELVQAQADYPIVLIKDAQTGTFHLVALLGLAQEQNLFISETGWNAEYIPLNLRAYPLAMTHVKDDESKQIVVFDSESHRVNSEEGEALFDEQGNETNWLEQQIEILGQIQAQSKPTQQFIAQLVEHELISPQSLTVTTKQGEQRNLTGLYILDEQKLKQLSATLITQLHQQHLLTPIYACLFSQQRISRLINLT